MHRFTQSITERLYMGMRFLANRSYNYRQIIDSSRPGGGHTAIEASIWSRIARGGVETPNMGTAQPFLEAAEAVMKSLYAGGATGSDGDLVDAIAAALQEPYAANRFGGVNLERLRTALLLPQELAGLTTRLASYELACVKCGKEFAPGEVATFQMGGLRDRPSGFACTRCAVPESTACVKCNTHTVVASPKLTKYVKTCACKACRGEGAEATSAPSTPGMITSTVTSATGGINLGPA